MSSSSSSIKRMTILDVCAMVKELKHTIVGLRVSNIYNIDKEGEEMKYISQHLIKWM